MSQPVSRPIRLCVAETSPISGQLLAEAIAKDPRIEVLGFASNVLEVMRITRASSPDILLISARMEEEPDRGLSLLRQLRVERPGLKAVVLLDSSKPAVVVEAFRSGASGVFCRSTAIELLRKCIDAVHAGQIWANSEELGFVLAALAARQSVQIEGKRLLPLSARERDVVGYLVEGLTNREIADKLVISHHTVKNYIFKIFDKLGVSNRVELVFQVLSEPIDAGMMRSNRRQEKTSTIPQSRGSITELGVRISSQSVSMPEPKQVSVLPSRATALSARSTARAIGTD
jgi:DNA-binding NarL/FixJ family response regulator